MNTKKKTSSFLKLFWDLHSSAFKTPVLLASILGVALASSFYAVIWTGLLNETLIKRYATCHLVAEVSVFMFAVAAVSMFLKLVTAKFQSKRSVNSREALRGLVSSAPQDSPITSADWLEKVWQSQVPGIQFSWLGQRVGEVISRQTARGRVAILKKTFANLPTRMPTPSTKATVWSGSFRGRCRCSASWER